ncbi:unnamed protein product [Rhizopus stolonifer]
MIKQQTCLFESNLWKDPITRSSYQIAKDFLGQSIKCEIELLDAVKSVCNTGILHYERILATTERMQYDFPSLQKEAVIGIQKLIQDCELVLNEKSQDLRRLEAQRNALNAKVRLLKEELQLLQEPGSYVGEVVKVMGKKKVLVKVHPEGKFVVDIGSDIDLAQLTPTTRVALRNDSYQLHKVLPNKIDPLVSLMMVEKVPDSTYEMVGGLINKLKKLRK